MACSLGQLSTLWVTLSSSFVTPEPPGLRWSHHGRQDRGLLCKSDIRVGNSGGNVHLWASQSECVRGRQQVGRGQGEGTRGRCDNPDMGGKV